MKWTLLFSIAIFRFNSCSDQSKSLPINQSIHYPTTIEFGSIGKGSYLPPSVIQVNQDTVKITYRKRMSPREMQQQLILATETQFVKMLSQLSKEDITGDKHYYDMQIRDGGYMIVKNPHGKRKFTNIFRHTDRSLVRPDTVGLSKFEELYAYANGILLEMQKQ